MKAEMYNEPTSLEYASRSPTFGSLEPWLTRGDRRGNGKSRVAFSEPSADPLTLAALHVSENVLKQLFDDSPIGVAVFEPTGRLLHFNRAFAVMLGYAAEDLFERCIDDFLHPDDVPVIQERRRMLMEGKCDTFQIETRFGTLCRRQVWARMHGRLQPREGDCSRQIFAHVVDLTAFEPIVRISRRDADEARLKNWDPERYM